MIDITTSLDELMHMLGCAPTLIQSAYSAGLKATYNLSGVQVFVQDEANIKDMTKPAHVTAPIKLGVLEQIINYKIKSGAAKSLAKIGLEAAVKTVLLNTKSPLEDPMAEKNYGLKAATETLAGVTAGDSMPDDVTETTTGTSLGDLLKEQIEKTDDSLDDLKSVFNPGKASVAKNETDAAMESADTTDVAAEAIHGTKVKLINATELYQPVQGSDSGSKYFCIAIHDDLNVAVRIKDQKTSIRVEGANLEKHEDGLSAAGLKQGSPHWSMHFDCGSTELARKSVGAAIYAIGVPFKKLTTNLSPIWNKGQ